MQLHNTLQTPSVKLKCLVLGSAAAGKTSLIRYFFYRKFDEGVRVPTLGSDWYTASIETSDMCNNKDRNHSTTGSDCSDPVVDDDNPPLPPPLPPLNRTISSVLVGIQMWDTPGRERFDAKRQRQHRRRVGDAFLRQADAILLVYDMTSSTSFTQLLKWFRDLTALVDDDFDDNDNNNNNNSNNAQQPKTRIPILICANKLDLFRKLQDHQQKKRLIMHKQPHNTHPKHNAHSNGKRRNSQASSSSSKSSSVLGRSDSQGGGAAATGGGLRDVLGLHGQFRGNDIRYEYQVSDEVTTSTTDSTAMHHHYRRKRSTTSLSSSSNNSLSSNNMQSNNTRTPLTSTNTTTNRIMPFYLADRENWTSDGSYLESLLTTEDQSFPDIEMVKLWCLRNGLIHVESSAATGEGVDAAFHQLIQIALERKSVRPPPPLLPDDKQDSLPSSSSYLLIPSSSSLSSSSSSLSPPSSSRALPAATKPYSPTEDLIPAQLPTRKERPEDESVQLQPQPQFLPPPIRLPTTRRNEPIDFHKRYAPKEKPCFCVPFVRTLLSFAVQTTMDDDNDAVISFVP